MRKSNQNNKGQLSIFMGITLILIMGMLAFIINVGLFVKAKINLQNAVDAAAFAGASVQSRQLTNIAYANWELRNTYKEWMFKYYVLGQIGLFPTNFTPGQLDGSGPVSYRLTVPGILNLNAATSMGNVPVDPYNLPSICIHNNTSKNICPLYMVPGLPRFKPIGVAGITEIHEAIVNDLVSKKAMDCSDRSTINYLAAMNWTYGSGVKDVPGAPLIAGGRPGSWPQAVELAMRIRNLEMIVNRPPVVGGIDRVGAENLRMQNPEIALNERPYKAFMSAFKNLSGGVYKDRKVDELAGNFKLYEIEPTPYVTNEQTASGFLIPSSYSYPGSEGGNALKKHYLDLQVMPVNYAIMYSTFTSTVIKTYDVPADGACGISKTAIPVPGYILGFVKNPQVLTYYAVRGESKFIGLFYPFTEQGGVKLTAYSAAKPFGGRIGPRLFNFDQSGSALKPRGDGFRKSTQYISSLIIPGSTFVTGMPIPFSQSFWAQDSQDTVLGGVPGSSNPSASPQYGIPNLIFDFNNEGELNSQNGGLFQGLQSLNKYGVSATATTSEKLGLYDRVQFKFLRDSLGQVTPSSNITSAQITNALIRSRRPTRYEAINYLIPDFTEIDPSVHNNVPTFISKALPSPGSPASGSSFIRYKLFAPLFGPALLYKNTNDAEAVINTYITTISLSVDNYLDALLKVATSILNTTTNSEGGGGNLLADAAKTIHINAGATGSGPSVIRPPLLNDANCAKDVASKFNHFFRANNDACGIQPIRVLMTEFLSKAQPSYYYGDYFIPGSDTDHRDKIKPIELMTAYFPGKRQGAQTDEFGTVTHPLNVSGTAAYSSRRNFYSTKFVQLAKVLDSQRALDATRGISDYVNNPLFKDKGAVDIAEDLKGIPVVNSIKFDATTGVDNNYFLNF